MVQDGQIMQERWEAAKSVFWTLQKYSFQSKELAFL